MQRKENPMSNKILVFNVIFRYKQDNNLNEMNKYTYIKDRKCLKYCVYYIFKFYVYHTLNINFCGFEINSTKLRLL